jgi:hypothetical protein
VPQAAFDAEVARLRAAGLGGQGGRLADLFDFLADRGPDAPSATQGEIAEAVFGQALVDADDASVRVYVHRLRKKLEDHYRANPAAEDGAMLELPAGIYALRLVGGDLAAEADPTPETEGAPSTEPNASARLPRTWLALAAMLLLAVFAAGWLIAGRGQGVPNPVWQPLAASDRPVLVVLGDYYLFGEIDPVAPEEGRLIRDFRVNSPADLIDMQESEPERYGNAEDVGLNYLPFQAAYALEDLAPLLAAQGKRVEIVPASQVTIDMLNSYDVVYIGLLSGMGLLEDITFADSTLRLGESYDEIYDRQANRRWVSDEARRLAAPVFYRDYAYVARFTAPGGALVTVVASERVTGLRGIGPIVTGEDLPDELASAARGDGFEALYQITGQQGADLSDRLVLARARE